MPYHAPSDESGPRRGRAVAAPWLRGPDHSRWSWRWGVAYSPRMSDDLKAGCYCCDQQAIDALAPREDVVHTDHWRVAHAFNSTLPGWLVVVPTRHVEAFTDLSPEAADELGGLVRRLSLALEPVTGCVKTYLMQFSEADGFSHLHLHLVPRLPDQPDAARGPLVFSYLSPDRSEWIPEADRDEIALAIRASLRSTAGEPHAAHG